MSQGGTYGASDYGEVSPTDGPVTRPQRAVAGPPRLRAQRQEQEQARSGERAEGRSRRVAPPGDTRGAGPAGHVVLRRRRAALTGGALVGAVVLVAVVAATSGGASGSGHTAGGSASAPARAHRSTGSAAAAGAAGAAARGVGKHNAPGRGRGAGAFTAGAGSGIPAVEAGLVDWQLQAPISREAVLPDGAGSMVVAGGETSGGSQVGVFRLDLATGGLTLLSSLPSATHDAASAQVGGNDLVLGGGSSAPADYAQGVSAAGTASSLGTLPGARADASAVTIAGTAYVVGGYSGTALDPSVLATTDGVHFRAVAKLAVPVRYPALAVSGGNIYVFGGSTLSGTPVPTVQVVEPSTGASRVLGQLPQALAGAAAASLGGHIYLAGGQTASVAGAAGGPSGTVYAYDVATGKFLVAGSLQVPVAYAGASVNGGRLWMIGGEVSGGAQTAYSQVVSPNTGFGYAGVPGAGSPYFGDKLLIADRGNNRLLVLDDTGKRIWEYPNRTAPPPPGGFYFPDDAFFIHHGTAIISNQEENETLVEIGYPSGKVLWQYGHPRQAGYAPGYLNNPDDAYLLKNGEVVVADPKNCRILFIDPATKTVIKQIGTSTVCYHNPPNYLGSPNGDTPLADGNILVSEINGSWIDEYTPQGKMLWSVHLPINYPSDPQPLGHGEYMVADYENPGSFLFFNRAGQVLYRYKPLSGPGELNQPSLGEMLPSGVVMLNDDYNDRIVAIDPKTNAVVWQYGHTGVAGTAPGLLNTPDGFDILGPGGTFPTHPVTG